MGRLKQIFLSSSVVRQLARLHFRFARRIVRASHPDWHPRRWSNSELKWVAKLCDGHVINVSAWRDEDKEGAKYSDYFHHCASYTISNYGGARGTSGQEGEVVIDLEKPLPPEFRRSFDVVLNHTTLEHVFDLGLAFKNLCELSRDLVVIILPFSQEVHWVPDAYLDYWRLTPFACAKLFEENGMELIYLNSNNNPAVPIYILAIGSRRPTDHYRQFANVAFPSRPPWLGSE